MMTNDNYLFLKTKPAKDFFKPEYNDDYLLMLFDVFKETKSFLVRLKKELLNPLSRGYAGNETSLHFNGKIIMISPLYAADPEECAITIDRSKLLDLINKWEEIIKLKPNEILFKRISSCIKIEPIFYEK